MIYFITKAEAKSLLTPDERGKYHGPRPGMEFDWYLVFNDPGWTAIDNSSGDAWTEDFNTIEEAIRWLESEESKEDMEENDKPLMFDGKPAYASDPNDVPAADDMPEGQTALANSGDSERDYSADDGNTGNLRYDFETRFDQDGLLHLHGSSVEFTALVTSSYERETGKSCVNWMHSGDPEIHDSLPRPDEYETAGFTDDFWDWMKFAENTAIDAGVRTVDEMTAFFLGFLTMRKSFRGGNLLSGENRSNPLNGEGESEGEVGRSGGPVPEKSALEREYDRIREAAKADKLAEKTRRRNVDAAVNKAVDELFELVKFVNKDGWQVDVCRVNNRHYLSSSDWQKTVKVELVPVVGQDVKFVAKGHVHHYGFTNCEPLTIPELAKWIVLLLANKDN